MGIKEKKKSKKPAPGIYIFAEEEDKTEAPHTEGKRKYKIGKTVDLFQRRGALGTGNWRNLKIVAFRESSEYTALETGLKRFFDPVHVKGDWYELTPEDIGNICNTAWCEIHIRPLMSPYKRKLKALPFTSKDTNKAIEGGFVEDLISALPTILPPADLLPKSASQLDAAVDILRLFGKKVEKYPNYPFTMHYAEITNKATELGYIVSNNPALKESIRTRMKEHIDKSKKGLTKQRIVMHNDGSGYYSLALDA